MWEASPMVLAASDRLRERVEGEAYERAVEEASSRLRFRLGAGVTAPGDRE